MKFVADYGSFKTTYTQFALMPESIMQVYRLMLYFKSQEVVINGVTYKCIKP